MADELIFGGKEAEWLRRIAKYYEVTKELIIFGEEVDPQNRTLFQSINEIRNSFDHLMRVVSCKSGQRKVDEEENYVEANFDKAFGHMYRAAYDTLDWISWTLKSRITDEMQDFELETIQAVMPEYFTHIKPELEAILDKIAALRMEKDVTVKSEENLVKYGQVTAELKQLFKAVISRKSALVEYHVRLKRSRRTKVLVRVLETLAVGTVIGILVYLLT